MVRNLVSIPTTLLLLVVELARFRRTEDYLALQRLYEAAARFEGRR